ncbi:MAG TPA: hypothetical protein VF171_04600 [Trueperaceae bacterium]
MDQDFVIAFSAYLFLAGIVMVGLSSFPVVRQRMPRLLVYGFAVAVLSFVMVLLAGLLPA